MYNCIKICTNCFLCNLGVMFVNHSTCCEELKFTFKCTYDKISFIHHIGHLILIGECHVSSYKGRDMQFR